MHKLFKTILFIVGIILISLFLGGDYDCNKKCIFYDVGGFVAVFTLMSFVSIFIDKLKDVIFDLWKIYIPAMFVLFSSIYYIDTTQHQENLKARQEYISMKMQYVTLEIKNIEKNDFDKVIGGHIEEYNKAFEDYANILLNGYKVIVGKAMIGLNIGFMAIVFLNIISIYRQKKK
jgi:hypothetical protein